MADFDPRQLDELEDALESLEHVESLEQLELEAALSERLAEYRDVLALCREAFPLESPDDQLLNDVIAEAHEVSRRPRLRDADLDHGAWRRLWERWRGTLVPGFALAGTAAAVLWLLDPQDAANTGAALLTEVDRSDRTQDEQRKQDEQTQPASEHGVERPTKQQDDGASEPTPPVAEAEAEVEPESLGSAGVEPSRPKPHKQAIAPAPAPAPEPLTKDEAWQSVERADGARRNGDCDRARSIYDEVIAASPDKLAIARAKAGVGLCFEQARQDSAAAKWLDEARATSPGIDAWISQQRDELPPHKNKSKRADKLDAFEAAEAL